MGARRLEDSEQATHGVEDSVIPAIPRCRGNGENGEAMRVGEGLYDRRKVLAGWPGSPDKEAQAIAVRKSGEIRYLLVERGLILGGNSFRPDRIVSQVRSETARRRRAFSVARSFRRLT